jgi:hypothetical protein
VPAKLDRCVDDLKAKGEVDNPWAVCNASIGKETKEHHNPLDIPFGYEVNGQGNGNGMMEKVIRERSDSPNWQPPYWYRHRWDSLYRGGGDPPNRMNPGSSGGANNPSAVSRDSNNQSTVKEQIIQEKVNANRMVPVFNPPIKVGKIEPQINKTTKGIGGLEGKIGEPVKNPKPSDLWKDIFDSQLKRNVKEPDI